MIVKIEDTKEAAALFEGWNETLIWSCLQGVMGAIYAPWGSPVRSVMALLGDFCFLAGAPDRELAGFKPESSKQNFIIMVPQTEEWSHLIEECYGNRAARVTRYAIKKEPGVFIRERLEAAVRALPAGYTLHMIDETIFRMCQENNWSRDLVSQYPFYEDYARLGMGTAVLAGEELVAGASSYSRYREGIEIEIDTREDHRRKGLAYACGAQLILNCLDRGLYPSWDAQNKWSVALAEKLGYHFECEYPVYEITDY